MGRATVSIDCRITAQIPGNGPNVAVTLYRFVCPKNANPYARLLPDTWIVVEVAMPRNVGFSPLGILRRVHDARALGCWITGDDLRKGKLIRALRPLSIYAPRPRIGPYR